MRSGDGRGAGDIARQSALEHGLCGEAPAEELAAAYAEWAATTTAKRRARLLPALHDRRLGGALCAEGRRPAARRRLRHRPCPAVSAGARLRRRSTASTSRETCWRSPGSAAPIATLKQAALGEPLPWPDGHFAAFFSTGVFTKGHAPASGLDELARITRPGGHAIFTVRDNVLDRGGFRDVFA